jgi:hypothetical protein
LRVEFSLELNLILPAQNCDLEPELEAGTGDEASFCSGTSQKLRLLTAPVQQQCLFKKNVSLDRGSNILSNPLSA